MRRCKDCMWYRDWECHAPVPDSAEDDYYPLLDRYPTNPEREVPDCRAFAAPPGCLCPDCGEPEP